MYYNNQLRSWTNFLHSLRIRFVPSQFEDPQGALFKLTQTIIVCDYQTQFELLSNRVVRLPHTFLLSCCISRLKPHIQREVSAYIMQAVDLPKLQEEKFIDIRKYQRFSYSSTSSCNQNSNLQPSSSPNPHLLPTSNVPLNAYLHLNCKNGVTKGCAILVKKNLYLVTNAKPNCFSWYTKMTILFRTTNPLQNLYHHSSFPNKSSSDQKPSAKTLAFSHISLHALLGHYFPETLHLHGTTNNKDFYPNRWG